MNQSPHVAIIGAGPAGLMAADTLSAAGVRVTIYERMPTPGRKLLMAGRGGLNLTHSEPFEAFISRYGEAAVRLRPMLEDFPPAALIAWAEALGQKTFTGSSGRVFPTALKASPLLRAWLARLNASGVVLRARMHWCGWDEAGALVFNDGESGSETVRPDATILALGGASWPKLGSDGAWTGTLAAHNISVCPLRPANCGFMVSWSDVFRIRFAGTPLKTIALRFADRTVRGEAMVTDYGLEGGAIYALSSALRDAVEAQGKAELFIDLRPDLSQAQLETKIGKAPAKQSAGDILRNSIRLTPTAIGLMREAHGVALPRDPSALAAQIKSAPIMLNGVQSIARSISSAGGVDFTAVTDTLMLREMPGVFTAGEMLDWEAPTGGYLLQATFATGVAAAKAALQYL